MRMIEVDNFVDSMVKANANHILNLKTEEEVSQWVSSMLYGAISFASYKSTEQKDSQRMSNDKIARLAANVWCRCHKCDGIARNIISENEPAVTFKCDKDNQHTCLKWYNGYRTAMIALDKFISNV